MSLTETMLLGAVTALSGAVGVLWRALVLARREADRDRREASRLIFALLGLRNGKTGEKIPPTASTPDRPLFGEAQQHAIRALNGDTERLLREYLSVPPT